MIRFVRLTLLAITLGGLGLFAPSARAANCGFDNGGNPIPCCQSTSSTCTSRQYTSATLLGRDANGRCLYQCSWDDTYTDNCSMQYTIPNSADVSAGPWSNNYCEPAVDPTFFCSYFFGTSC